MAAIGLSWAWQLKIKIDLTRVLTGYVNGSRLLVNHKNKTMYEKLIKVSFRRSALIDSALARCLADDKAKQAYRGVWTATDTIRRLMRLPHVLHEFTDGSIAGVTSFVRFTSAEVKTLDRKQAGEPDNNWGRRMIVSGLIREGYLKADPRKTKAG